MNKLPVETIIDAVHRAQTLPAIEELRSALHGEPIERQISGGGGTAGELLHTYGHRHMTTQRANIDTLGFPETLAGLKALPRETAVQICVFDFGQRFYTTFVAADAQVVGCIRVVKHGLTPNVRLRGKPIRIAILTNPEDTTSTPWLTLHGTIDAVLRNELGERILCSVPMFIDSGHAISRVALITAQGTQQLAVLLLMGVEGLARVLFETGNDDDLAGRAEKALTDGTLHSLPGCLAFCSTTNDA